MSRAMLGILLFTLFYLMAEVISRMIKTEYIVHTEGFLEIKRGRLTKTVCIDLKDIKQIDKVRRSGTLIIVTNDDKEYYLIPPKNEDEFIRCIEKYRS